jgi:phosphoribosylaminoimidazolecarboxamide formyltransferase/IMP cyclohydrolase
MENPIGKRWSPGNESPSTPLHALLSVYDKRGIAELGQRLDGFGWHVWASGGTMAEINAEKPVATDLAEHIGIPRILNGAVITLNHKTEGGILAQYDAQTEKELTQYDIFRIHLVVCNFYPLAKAIGLATTKLENRGELGEWDMSLLEEVQHNMDIGGPTMVRSAIKRAPDRIVLTDPGQYPVFLDHIEQGTLDEETVMEWAAQAAITVAKYDAVAADFLQMFNRYRYDYLRESAAQPQA